MIVSFVTLLALGIIICGFGIMNCSGNISTLHWYHRSRVSEENVKAYGKMIGTGTLVIGISVIVYAISTLVSWITSSQVFTLIGMIIMLICLVVGMVISFRAMFKYNGGIF